MQPTALRERQRHVAGASRRILGDRDEAGHALAVFEGLAHRHPHRPGRHHDDVDVIGRDDALEADAVAAREVEGLPRTQRGADVAFVDLFLDLVRNRDDEDVRPGHRLAYRHRGKAVAFRAAEVRVLAVADDDIDSAVAHVEGLRPALVAVSEHADREALEHPEIDVVVEDDPAHVLSLP